MKLRQFTGLSIVPVPFLQHLSRFLVKLALANCQARHHGHVRRIAGHIRLGQPLKRGLVEDETLGPALRTEGKNLTLGKGYQPRQERTRRIEVVHAADDREIGVLHHVVDVVRVTRKCRAHKGAEHLLVGDEFRHQFLNDWRFHGVVCSC